MRLWRSLKGSIVVFCAFLTAGCGVSGVGGVATEADVAATTASASAAPKFQGGEKIRINVYNEPSLSGDHDIDQNGVISLPLAGTIKASGLTQAQFEQELARKFRSEYLRNPKVTVSILNYRPIYIVGEVEKQGEYAFKPGLNVLTAMASAGGGTYRAHRNYVLIQHFGETSMKEYPQSAATMVLPGDLIKVPERYF
jgi:protein involved in polysaccharide export with SLBB domain